MKQMGLSERGFERKTKRTRKREFLDEMNLVVPWAELVTLIAPHGPRPGTKGGRPPFAVDTMLRIHFLQQRATTAVHIHSFELLCCRSDLFNASSISRLARKLG
jgi:hypothetical protein